MLLRENNVVSFPSICLPNPTSITWISTTRRYLFSVLSVLAHLFWELAQLPLYTIWKTGTVGEQENHS